MAHYEIFVTYRKGIFDPPGATVKRALENLGYPVSDVKIGKYIQLESDADYDGVREMCEKLLANPVIEDFRINRVEDIQTAEEE